MHDDLVEEGHGLLLLEDLDVGVVLFDEVREVLGGGLLREVLDPVLLDEVECDAN